MSRPYGGAKVRGNAPATETLHVEMNDVSAQMATEGRSRAIRARWEAIERKTKVLSRKISDFLLWGDLQLEDVGCEFAKSSEPCPYRHYFRHVFHFDFNIGDDTCLTCMDHPLCMCLAAYGLAFDNLHHASSAGASAAVVWDFDAIGECSVEQDISCANAEREPP
jgi:hypothetical protein